MFKIIPVVFLLSGCAWLAPEKTETTVTTEATTTKF